MSVSTTTVLAALRQKQHDIRNTTTRSSFASDRAAMSDIRTGYYRDKPVRRLVITFRAPGCAWVGRGGGCLMCGHHAGTLMGKLPTCDDYVTQFRTETAEYNLSGITVLSMYNSGSMLNPGEFPTEALLRICRDIREIPSIKKVVLESRAEFVDSEPVGVIRDALGPDITLTVAIGLETADDTRRELCINKGCATSEIIRAVKSVRGIAETQLYVLLGLPFLTEREALEDAVGSIRFAGSLHADEIHIEPLTLQSHTLTGRMVRAGIMHLPSLHTIYEVLRRVVPDIRPYVSPFLHMPLPDIIPSGCPECTDRLISGLLDVYNIHRDRDSLEYEYCRCMETWRKELEIIDERPLIQRITDALACIEEKALP